MNPNGKELITSICNRLEFEGKLCTDNAICSLIRSLDRYEIAEVISFGTTQKWENEIENKNKQL